MKTRLREPDATESDMAMRPAIWTRTEALVRVAQLARWKTRGAMAWQMAPTAAGSVVRIPSVVPLVSAVER